MARVYRPRPTCQVILGNSLLWTHAIQGGGVPVSSRRASVSIWVLWGRRTISRKLWFALTPAMGRFCGTAGTAILSAILYTTAMAWVHPA